MNTLPPALRRSLERAAAGAREVAEQGARAALEALAVHEREPWAHMTADQRALRNRLRALARQLGDKRDAQSGAQGIERLVRECACEHWHAMLFARFLAENNLLIDPLSEVPVTLAECEELAREEGRDKWSFAADLAQCTLPNVFRPGHPAFSAPPAREHQQKLERLVEDLPPAVFKAADSLGWVYQFWQSRRKDEVNRSEVKIGADELPAVTQLFTEPYMVSFLLDNTLGAWWAAFRLTTKDLAEAASEDELRRKAALPGVPLRYLRFARGENGRWRPVAGTFDDWPDEPAALKVLDPCCGSGHFLTAALAMLAPMRMEREGLAAADAVDAVLRDNLRGLEIDPRCVELAAFALALTAWTWPGAEGHRDLPELRVACSGLAVGAARQQWAELAAGNRNLRIALSLLHHAFREAPTLGSLLDPYAEKAAKLVDRRDLAFALDRALLQEERVSDERREAVVAAQGIDEAAALLAGRYHLVATNVPYLGRSKQNENLREFVGNRYPAAKHDLATVFLERCLELCAQGGTAALVMPQNWLFLTRYRKLREKLLKRETWHLLARLGEGGFDSTAAAGAFVAMLALSRGEAAADSVMHGLDVSESRTAGEKAVRLIEAEVNGIKQARQLENPDARIAIEDQKSSSLMSKFAEALAGLQTSDDPRFIIAFWELESIEKAIWEYMQSTPVDGLSWLVRWEQGKSVLFSLPHALPTRGLKAVGSAGIAIHRMRKLFAYRYSKERFHQSVAVVVPTNQDHLPAIWCFCSSPEYHEAVRRIDQKLNVTNATLVKVPFDLDRWQKIAAEKYPNGLPRPYSDDPTQWIFHGHPCGSAIWDEAAKRTACGPLRADGVVLQIAAARLLGYRWPAERDEAMELADEQREWARRCEALLPFADADGIVCIPSVRGEAAAAERLLQLLAAAYGDAWNEGVPARLLAAAGAADLDDWLRNRFFEQHCKLFHQRPFVWHVWDGRRRDGFHALISQHKLSAGGGAGRRLLEALTWSYLGDWIERRRDGVKRGEDGAEDRLAAALELQARLEAVLEGEPPHDIFARWKPLAEQPIGWEPDIDDGVRVNIRPFLAEDVPGGKKGAGILRAKPNIHWRKDRGKEPQRDAESFPWFYDADGRFRGERVNDVHLKVADKRAARQKAAEKR